MMMMMMNSSSSSSSGGGGRVAIAVTSILGATPTEVTTGATTVS